MKTVGGRRWLLLAAAATMLVLSGCAAKRPPKEVTSEKCGMTIRLSPGAAATCGLATPSKAVVSKSLDDGRVRWRNVTNVSQTVHFEVIEWIFETPWPSGGDIVVASKSESPWFRIKSDTSDGVPHPYSVTPLLDGCGPQEPAITADP